MEILEINSLWPHVMKIFGPDVVQSLVLNVLQWCS